MTKKRVRFDYEQNIVHHEAPHHHTVDPSTVWLTKNDYHRMKKNDEIVLSFMVNCGDAAQCSGMCTRGLEKRTPEGNQDKQYNRLYAICEVLAEQERQRVQRVTDVHRIASVYKEATIESRREAIEYGMLDEQTVFQAIMEGGGKKKKKKSTTNSNKNKNRSNNKNKNRSNTSSCKSSTVSSNKTAAAKTTTTTMAAAITTQRSRSRSTAHRMQRLFGLPLPR